MAKTINFSYKGIDYTLEYTRKSAQILERQGLTIEAVSNIASVNTITVTEMLIQGAFLAHHKGTSKEIITDISDNITDKQSFVSKLIEMYVETVTSLINGTDEGNIEWTVG